MYFERVRRELGSSDEAVARVTSGDGESVTSNQSYSALVILLLAPVEGESAACAELTPRTTSYHSEREDTCREPLIIAQSSGEGKVLDLLHFSQQMNYSLCVEAIP